MILEVEEAAVEFRAVDPQAWRQASTHWRMVILPVTQRSSIQALGKAASLGLESGIVD